MTLEALSDENVLMDILVWDIISFRETHHCIKIRAMLQDITPLRLVWELSGIASYLAV